MSFANFEGDDLQLLLGWILAIDDDILDLSGCSVHRGSLYGDNLPGSPFRMDNEGVTLFRVFFSQVYPPLEFVAQTHQYLPNGVADLLYPLQCTGYPNGIQHSNIQVQINDHAHNPISKSLQKFVNVRFPHPHYQYLCGKIPGGLRV